MGARLQAPSPFQRSGEFVDERSRRDSRVEFGGRVPSVKSHRALQMVEDVLAQARTMAAQHRCQLFATACRSTSVVA